MPTDPKEFEKWLDLVGANVDIEKLRFLPVVANGKEPDVPRGKSWKAHLFGWREALERLKQGKNVGFVAMPETLCVVDLDLAKIKDEKLKEEVINLFPESLTVKTQSGGEHRYYLNKGVLNADAKGRYRGCGEVRANYKYVLVAGSCVNGKVYRVEKEMAPQILDKVPEDWAPYSFQEALNLAGEYEEFKNVKGWKLSDIVVHDPKLHDLITSPERYKSLKHPDYPTPSEPDMALLSKLKWWGFDFETSCKIIRKFRGREKLYKHKTYLPNTWKKIVHIRTALDIFPEDWDPRYSTITEYVEGLEKQQLGVLEKPLDLDLISEGWLKRYILYLNKLTDAYVEYKFLSGIFLLSCISFKTKINVKPSWFHPEIWILLVGRTHTARKTTILNLTRDILEDLFPHNVVTEFTEEGLVTRLEKNNVVFFFKDEFQDFVKKVISKKYLSGLFEFLCSLYDARRKFVKTLAKKEIKVDEPFFNWITSTTPTVFDFLNQQIETGFLNRFIICFPDYEKGFLDPDNIEAEDIEERTKIQRELQEIYEQISDKQFVFSKEGLRAIGKYERDKEIKEEVKDLISRKQNFLKKLAYFLYIGSDDFLKQKHGERIEIPFEYVKRAIGLYENFFLKHMQKVYLYLREEGYALSKILRVFLRKRTRVLSHSELLRYSHLNIKKFNEIIKTLQEREEIDVITVMKNGKEVKKYIWRGEL